MAQAWDSFVDSIQKLDPKSTMVGAAALLLIGGFGKYFLVPFFQWLGRHLRDWLYPIFSGAFVIDRLVSLPKYCRALIGTVSEIPNPWLIQKQRLTDIFVPVSATTGERSGERIELGSLFLRHNRLVLIGDPGSGKTTGLKAIALRCLREELRGKSRRSLVPVVISLRQFAQAKKTLRDFILDEFAKRDFPGSHRTVKRLIRQCRLVFLLDGLDEVEETERPSVIEAIREEIWSQNDADARCHLLLTSRPVGYDGQLAGIVDSTVTMAEFTPADIRKFVANWSFQPPKSEAELLDAVLTRAPILRIAQNPLMLTIITYLYAETQYQLPDSREEFYKICLQALLRAWDAARNIDDRNKIPAEQKAAFLQRFAFNAIKEARFDFNGDKVLEEIDAFRKERDYKNYDAQRWLLELRRSGLFTLLPTGEILFAHLTLAESLTAAHLRRNVAELSSQWRARPSGWLEVCSLYVADPDASSVDIARLIDDARSADNFSGAIILAGEAHTLPDPQRRWITESVLPVARLWPSYDQRTVNAIAAFPDAAGTILPAMLGHNDLEIRSRALRALGLIRQPWAIKLLLKALTSESTRDAAIVALTRMGPDALSILETVLNAPDCQESTALAATSVLERLGDMDALDLILTQVCIGSRSLRLQAALAAGRLLANSLLRETFESTKPRRIKAALANAASSTCAIDPKLIEVITWLDGDTRTHRECYARVVGEIVAYISVDPFKRPDIIEGIGSRLLVPIALFWDERLRGGDRVSPNLSHFDDFWRRTKEDVTPSQKRLKSLFQYVGANQRSAREQWLRIRSTAKSDICLGEFATTALCSAICVARLAPLIVALFTARITPYWLIPHMLLGSFLLASGDDIREFLYYLGAPLPMTVCVLQEKRAGAGYSILLLIGAVFAEVRGMLALGPQFWWLLVLLVLTGFCRLNDLELVVYRRHNPFRSLLDEWEAEEQGEKAIAPPIRSTEPARPLRTPSPPPVARGRPIRRPGGTGRN